MNALTKLPNLPPHLMKLAANTALTTSTFSAGISSGGVPHISIKSSRFRLISAGGEEVLVNSLNLDVICVEANQYISKVFYAGAYDPNGEDKAPDCFSDNSFAPSASCTSPQAKTCAVCPNNAWGSKISKTSGKGVKACADVKKVAVILADNPDGPVYLLRIPPASLKNFGEYIGALDKHSIPASLVITRLTFDPQASHPKLMFAPAWLDGGQMPYINEAQAAAIEDVLGTDEVDKPIGKHDKPIDANKVLAAPAPAVAQAPVASPAMPPLPPIPQANQSPQPEINASQAVPVALPPALPPVPPTAGTQPTAPRTRRKRGESAPAEAAPEQQTLPPTLGGPAAPPVNQAFQHSPVQNAAAAVTPINPPVADASLAAMLDVAMRA